MPAFEVVYVDGRPTDVVEAERWEQRGTALVFTTTTLVMHRSREVVRLRVLATDVAGVRSLA